ncbi:multicomponent Na+:H+ antiporter subunit C [Clostridium tetanomorphum]|uniref:Cation:proton antiporter n=1 Tax=Clostridium tetanomorphum TaxID=1553 RepID=A0A923E900_CLOTT|nr:sodium:proton antiporter [Clostridium tetanomorphum]KAJ53369.1 monovalent cation/H+ antiporter subunit C [Clostridium tetanomorphum DSM 665]MBC2396644.1 cation:proton antiporter [Clostridium tetanomorphum]MBP1863975.1 multicomponent Na+:H+ antiporter subunit C [Clostridium tetanomorphum]NRS85053.1 multicomponent Na+:H+ antiporter subunit C [Clostridium tetanomorphum]NRZ98270.1 multicomponent Na+:H+ antiporter subunit C [Clostridium tetanomorphum]
MIVNYIGSFIVILLGLYIMMTKKNLIKIVIGMSLLDSGLNLLLVSIGFRAGGTAPIFITDLKKGAFFVDPVPQALTLTSIVIGACVLALALSLVIKIKEKYGTINADKVRRLRG